MTEEPIQEPPVEPVADPSGSNGTTLPEPPPPKGAKTKLLTISLTVVLMATAGVALYLRSHQPAALVSTTPRPKASQVVPPNFCFIRLDKFVCIDKTAGQRARYDLPQIDNQSIEILVPSPDGTKYAAVATSDNTPATIWLVDQNLKPIKKLVLPNGDTALGPSPPDGGISWSHNGKFLLITLDLPVPAGTATNPQVFKYSVASNMFSQLTHASPSSGAHELADGRIYYWTFNQATYGSHPMVMNTDGSGAKTIQELNFIPSEQITESWAYYDIASDTLLFAHDTSNNQTQIYSWPGAKLGTGAKPVTITTQFSGSTQFLGAFDSQTLIFQHDQEIDFLDASTGQIRAKTIRTGTPVGVITKRGGLKLSAPQEESKYERIRNLSTAPPDFQTFIKARFDAADADCSKGDYGAEAGFSIFKIVRDTYASGGEGCLTGAGAYYKKINGQWTYLFSLQNEPDCDMINKYTFTKEIITECYDAAQDKSVANSNP